MARQKLQTALPFRGPRKFPRSAKSPVPDTESRPSSSANSEKEAPSANLCCRRNNCGASFSSESRASRRRFYFPRYKVAPVRQSSARNAPEAESTQQNRACRRQASALRQFRRQSDSAGRERKTRFPFSPPLPCNSPSSSCTCKSARPHPEYRKQARRFRSAFRRLAASFRRTGCKRASQCSDPWSTSPCRPSSRQGHARERRAPPA